MEKKLKNIEHPGVVEEISDNNLQVRIKTRKACGSCKSKSHCGFADVEDKIIDIEAEDPKKYEIGQNVIVTLKESLGYKALLIGYLIPLIILLATLILMMVLTGSEPLSALLAVLVMVPYYIMVYVYRNKLRKTFNFYIKE